MSPLLIAATGQGTLTPNYSNAVLQIGKSYSIVATPVIGFTFTNWVISTNWIGGVVSNNATLNFVMQSNLTLQVNFADTAKPTNTIISPTQGQSWSNQVFTIQGKASDNVAVANVYYQLNTNGWNQPTPINNWSNWQATVSLQPGNNVLQAYAVDTTGNYSITNLVNFTYILTDTLHVQTTGQGTLTPNLSNQVLQIGQSYSMTAAGVAGFSFTNWVISTNWIGSVVSNSATLNFVMQSNLTLQANFVDTNKPTLSITNLVAGQRWSNLVFTAKGTATDNWQVASVQVQLNNSGTWTTATGTTNWSVPLTLTPGTNTLAAYAVDNSGNVSATTNVNFQYVVTNQLQLSITGLGTISPNYSNAWLEIGRNYSITSTPAAGFMFTNWTGSLTTNTAALNFMMASNLTFIANFIDTNKPVVAITNITAGINVSNAAFTVMGTATDNVAVASVYVSLTNSAGIGAWALATGTNDWSLPVMLAPGTNTVFAYAVDPSGNLSTTNKVGFNYVVSAPLTVQMTGRGTVSPNDSNAVLQVGANYSMTAAVVAGSGFAFTNWTGGTSLPLAVLTNGALLQFVMQSNLVLQANFVDTNKPVLSITNLVAGQRWSNQVFTVQGTATDNWQVASVQYQLNGGTWTNATGTTNWSVPLTLTPGTNTFAAYAMDNSGNVSATTNVNFQYVVTNLLSVRATGLGTISPNYSNAWLEIGRNYSITSSPAAGFVATNWTISTNWIGGRVTNNATVQFMMASNLTLEINFADMTKPTLVVSSPTANQRMTNALAKLIGTATDNWKVTGVWYQLNSNGWNLVSSANNFTNWTNTVTLLNGTNYLNFYALDPGGNISATNFSIVSSNTFNLQLAFTNAVPMKTNGLVFSLQLSTGLNGQIQVSTNLINWATLTNFVGTNSTLTFRDPAATNSNRRFYRAVIP